MSTTEQAMACETRGAAHMAAGNYAAAWEAYKEAAFIYLERAQHLSRYGETLISDSVMNRARAADRKAGNAYSFMICG